MMREPTTAAEVWERARAVQRRRDATRIVVPMADEATLLAAWEPAPPPKKEEEEPEFPAATRSMFAPSAERVLLDIVARRTGISLTELYLSQTKVNVFWRQVVAHIAFKVAHHSTHNIAMRLKRDPTTVRYGLARLARIIAAEPEGYAACRLQEVENEFVDVWYKS
jgi:hypothetical protein